MGEACGGCGGGGYRWTGGERILCGRCWGSGREKPRDEWLTGPPQPVHDPNRNRLR